MVHDLNKHENYATSNLYFVNFLDNTSFLNLPIIAKILILGFGFIYDARTTDTPMWLYLI